MRIATYSREYSEAEVSDIVVTKCGVGVKRTFSRGVVDAMGIVTDVRLGSLFAGSVYIAATMDQVAPVIAMFVAMTVCLVEHMALSRARWPWSLAGVVPVMDLFVSIFLVFMVLADAHELKPLWVGFVLSSAVFVGIVSAWLWATIWTVSVCSAMLMVSSLGGEGILLGSIMVAIGVVACVILGDRWFRKVSDLENASRMVARARAEKAALAERMTIARDLHDSLAKSVNGIRMLAEVLNDSLCSEGHSEAEISDAIFRSADSASREARIVLDGLRSSGEEDTVAALKEAVSRWGARTRISPEFCISSTVRHISTTPSAMWQLQRIVGEALVNVEKHSGADHLYFRADRDSDGLLLELADDGSGVVDIDSAHVVEGHYGLQGMFERAEMLGGRIEVESQPCSGIGLRTRIHVPIVGLDAQNEVSA